MNFVKEKLIEGLYGISSIYMNGVYKMFHINYPDKLYIGSATRKNKKKHNTGFFSRWTHHIYTLRNNKHHSKHFQSIVNKYGIEGVRFQIINVLESTEECLECEQHYLDTINPIFNSAKSAYSAAGYKHTEETKKNWSVQRKGRKVSEEVKIYLSSVSKGIPQNTSHLRTKDVRDKVKLSLKGRKAPESTYDIIRKPIIQYSTSDIVIAEYSSIQNATDLTKIDRGSISNCAAGKRKSAGGYKWKFKK